MSKICLNTESDLNEQLILEKSLDNNSISNATTNNLDLDFLCTNNTLCTLKSNQQLLKSTKSSSFKSLNEQNFNFEPIIFKTAKSLSLTQSISYSIKSNESLPSNQFKNSLVEGRIKKSINSLDDNLNLLNQNSKTDDSNLNLNKHNLSKSLTSLIKIPWSKKQIPSNYDRINIGFEDEMIIESYILSYSKLFVYYIAVILSLGLLMIYTELKPSLKIRLTHSRCGLEEASAVILKDNQDKEYVEIILKPDKDGMNDYEYIHFYHKKLKYIWRPERHEFVKLTGLDYEKCGVIYSYTSGLTKQEAEDKYNLYGPNSIQIDVHPVWKIVIEELKNPFYIYQVFVVIVWCLQLYYQFAFCVLTFSLVTITWQAYETKMQNKLLKEKVQSENKVTVIRSSSAKKISSTKLVPGDLLILTKPCLLNCDAVLIDGATCTVNESMLTGECIPIPKTCLIHKPDQLYSPKTNKKNTLFCGTEVLQVHPQEPNGCVKAVVVRTGYSTAKGELVRAILFPKGSNKSLYSDLIKCMKMFLVLGLPCMFYTAYIFQTFKIKLVDLILVVTDIATFVVPPLLPSVMTSINMHAQKRLLKKKIFCLNSSYINSCGTIDVAVFDKTGTITEDSLGFSNILLSTNQIDQLDEKSNNLNTLNNTLKKFEQIDHIFKDSNEHLEKSAYESIKYSNKMRRIIEQENLLNIARFNSPTKQNLNELPLNNLILTIACCHSLIYFDGKLNGDVLDLKMFEQLNWKFLNAVELSEFNNLFYKIPDRIVAPRNEFFEFHSSYFGSKRLIVSILKEFSFESSLQRMVVIAKPIIYKPSNLGQSHVIKQSFSVGDVSFLKEDENRDFDIFMNRNDKQRTNSTKSNHFTPNKKYLNVNNNYIVLMKGAPEKVISFCRKETIPLNFNKILSNHAIQGFRLIACASKTIKFSSLDKLNKCQLNEIENDLTFDGLIIFNNRIKNQSKPSIIELKQVDIRCLMATGDNLLTGVNVARNCGLVNLNDLIIQIEAEFNKNRSELCEGSAQNNEHIEYLNIQNNQFDNEDDKFKFTKYNLGNKKRINKNKNSIKNNVENNDDFDNNDINLINNNNNNNSKIISDNDQYLKVTYKILNQPDYDNSSETITRTDDEVTIPMLETNDFIEKDLNSKLNKNLFKLTFSYLFNQKQDKLSTTINQLDEKKYENYHFCCEGVTFQLLKNHHTKLYNYLLHKGVVFARMSPTQKQQLITDLQCQNHQVAMIGDGANDCAALRNANCGLSLSTAESAVAAPFSTSHDDISVFKYLICEGKATISATFGAFKYQVSYCFVLLVGVMMLFWHGIFPSDGAYILIDIILNLAPPFVFGTTAAYHKLVKRRPNDALFCFSTLFSIFSFVILQFIFYIIARLLLIQQEWYEPYVVDHIELKASSPTFIATTILSVNMMTYIISAIIYSSGPPFRRSFFSNKLYIAVIFLNFLIIFFIAYYPAPSFILKYMAFKEISSVNFKFTIFLLSILNLILSYFWEVVLLQNVVPLLYEKYFKSWTKRKLLFYEQLDNELRMLYSQKSWPPIIHN